jgi:hypothetical protein
VPVNRERFNSEGYWNRSRKSSALFDVPGADRPELDVVSSVGYSTSGSRDGAG